MKTTILLMIACLLSGAAQGQPSISTTNMATVAEAVKIASGLQYRMKESDANEYLVNHDMTCDTNRTLDIYVQDPPDNNYLSFSTSYPLKGNCCLDLFYWHPETSDTGTNTDKRWERDGMLTGAEIESNWTERVLPRDLTYGQTWESNDMKNYIPIKLAKPK